MLDMFEVLLVVACAGCAQAHLWPQGVVHYSINKKDYDVHSQDTIMETLSALQREICVKFFNTPGNYTASPLSRILYISNPGKQKECPPQQYNFRRTVVDMTIGYKCLDPVNITNIIVDMLRASIEQSSAINSYDLVKKIRTRDEEVPRGAAFLTAKDRNYLNVNYLKECGLLAERSHIGRRSGGDDSSEDEFQESTKLSEQNVAFYRDLLWPLGVVMYGVDPTIKRSDPSLHLVQHAMATIEAASCVVFQPLPSVDVLETNNFLWLGTEGEDLPQLGFRTGNQSLKVSSLAVGAPGHAAHTLNALLRGLALPMMSNRFDRDNYVTINWSRVKPGKEQYLERSPEESWLRQIPYDITSATHASANFMCRDCDHPAEALTVLPLQDHLWQRTLTIGRQAELSESDKTILQILYNEECHKRALKGSNNQYN